MAKWDSKTVTDAAEDSGKVGAPGGSRDVCSGIFSGVRVAQKVTFEQRLKAESGESRGSGVGGGGECGGHGGGRECEGAGARGEISFRVRIERGAKGEAEARAGQGVSFW